MHVRSCDHVEVPLPEGHPFPMEKYRALRLRLLGEGVLAGEELLPAEPAPLDALRTVHDPGYVDAFVTGSLPREVQRRIGFPWSPALVARTRASVGGTLAAARAALAEGLAGNLAGGTHHAHPGHGSGYCVFNDLAVTAAVLLAEGRVGRVLVFDVDVHQGDGTAASFAGDERVFTASLHGERNFPLRKVAGDLDVALPDGTGDEAYLAALDRALDEALARSRPELVLVQAGVDPLAEDHLGRLAVSREGLEERDRRLLAAFRGAGLPVVLTLGGGYARPIEATLAAHLGTYRVAKALEAASAGSGRG